MTCQYAQQIGPYHDGELPAERAAEVERHVEQCPQCRRELDGLRAISQWLAAAPAPDVTDEALGRLRRSLRPRRDSIILRTAAALSGVAAAVLIVCSALLWQRLQTAPPVTPPAGWESLAITPVATEVKTPAEEIQTDTATEVDARILRTIAGLATVQNGNSHE